MSTRTAATNLAATRSVRARLLPLLVLLVFVVSLSAPLAMYLLQLSRLRMHTRAVGTRVASLIAHQARHHPRLWRYNTGKLVDHVKRYEHQVAVDRVVITDQRGRPVSELDPARLALLRKTPMIWSQVEIRVDGLSVGRVWVATSASRVRKRFFLALAGFAIIALALGLLIYRIPLRTLSRAEARTTTLLAQLERSQAELAELNQSLEARIEERSSALAAANRELQGKEQNLRELSARALAMGEAERRAIGRELHDGVGQALTAVRINLQLLGQRADDIQYVRTQAERTLALTDGILEEVRRAVRTLGPAIVAEVGLAAAVTGTCEDFAERTGTEVACHVDMGAAPLDTATENACYRILGEALTNVTRHARASKVTVRLHRKDTLLRLRISDDGRGFDPEALPTPGDGHGLRGIRERVELLGGRFRLTSAADQGTTLAVDFPRQTGQNPDSSVDAEPVDAPHVDAPREDTDERQA